MARCGSTFWPPCPVTASPQSPESHVLPPGIFVIHLVPKRDYPVKILTPYEEELKTLTLSLSSSGKIAFGGNEKESSF